MMLPLRLGYCRGRCCRNLDRNWRDRLKVEELWWERHMKHPLYRNANSEEHHREAIEQKLNGRQIGHHDPVP
jgi:hypothetical protein